MTESHPDPPAGPRDSVSVQVSSALRVSARETYRRTAAAEDDTSWADFLAKAVLREVEREAADARPHDPGRPAEVERRGSHFWASCRVCPWEGDDRFIHFDAAADAAQHNDRAHQPQTVGLLP